MTELSLLFAFGCVACYFAGTKRRQAVDRDMELIQLESRALTAEESAAVAGANAAAWKEAFEQSEAHNRELESRAGGLHRALVGQTLINGIMYHRVFEFMRNSVASNN